MISSLFNNVMAITEFRTRIKETIDNLIEPLVIIRRNKPQVVVVPYEQFVKMETIVEEHMDLELIRQLEERIGDPEAVYMSHEDFFKELGV